MNIIFTNFAGVPNPLGRPSTIRSPKMNSGEIGGGKPKKPKGNPPPPPPRKPMPPPTVSGPPPTPNGPQPPPPPSQLPPPPPGTLAVSAVKNPNGGDVNKTKYWSDEGMIAARNGNGKLPEGKSSLERIDTSIPVGEISEQSKPTFASEPKLRSYNTTLDISSNNANEPWMQEALAGVGRKVNRIIV